MKNINDYLLTATVTVGQLRHWMEQKNDDSKRNIIDLIYHRFFNRYLKHLPDIKSGFLRMAICCLMIETIESFKQGEKNTKGKSQKMFKDFFESEEESFPGFKDIHSEFYFAIRCGILHQAETTHAWRILGTGKLLDREDKSINSAKFVKSMKNVLSKYVECLRAADFNSQVWKNALLKLDDICENCKPDE